MALDCSYKYGEGYLILVSKSCCYLFRLLAFDIAETLGVWVKIPRVKIPEPYMPAQLA